MSQPPEDVTFQPNRGFLDDDEGGFRNGMYTATIAKHAAPEIDTKAGVPASSFRHSSTSLTETRYEAEPRHCAWRLVDSFTWWTDLASLCLAQDEIHRGPVGALGFSPKLRCQALLAVRATCSVELRSCMLTLSPLSGHSPEISTGSRSPSTTDFGATPIVTLQSVHARLILADHVGRM